MCCTSVKCVFGSLAFLTSSMRVLILKSNGGAYKTALKHTTQPLIPTMYAPPVIFLQSKCLYLICLGQFILVTSFASCRTATTRRKTRCSFTCVRLYSRVFRFSRYVYFQWGKFQIIAKIVWSMAELQDRLRVSNTYNFEPHPDISQLIDEAKPMSEEVSSGQFVPTSTLNISLQMIVEKTFPTLGETPPSRSGYWNMRVLRKVLG